MKKYPTPGINLPLKVQSIIFILNSFRLFVIDFFDSYDNKCQKV